jgi:hypothetical protein
MRRSTAETDDPQAGFRHCIARFYPVMHDYARMVADVALRISGSEPARMDDEMTDQLLPDRTFRALLFDTVRSLHACTENP